MDLPSPPGAGPDVLELILEHARRAPGQGALSDHRESLSYAGLAEQAAMVAAQLAALGAEPGDRVALYLGNTVDFVLTALGCLWLGAPFVPLSAADPAARVARIVEDCRPCVIVAKDPAAVAALGEVSGARVAASRQLRGGASVAAGPRAATSERDVYLIYTSGTSGVAKGVCVQERALRWSLVNVVNLLGFGTGTRSLAVSAFHFDGSFATLFGTLLAGGHLTVPPREELLFIKPFFNAVLDHHINNTSFSPSYLSLLVAAHDLRKLAGSELRTVALGGEAVVPADIAGLWEVLPEARVFNRYGPTEATIAVTSYEVTPADVASGEVPIGKPHAGVNFHILGPGNRPLAGPGEVGELYIGGEQLMRGYWGDPLLTDSVLRRDVVAGEVLYRTGDLAYGDGTGRYFYVGRADDVVKRNGVRVGLDEVARALREVEGVSSAICLPVDRGGHLGITAFVVASPDLTSLRLLEEAGRYLPAAMLPDEVLVVGSFPITGAGKVDRRRLLAEAGRAGWQGA